MITELVLPPADRIEDMTDAERLALRGRWIRRDARREPRRGPTAYGCRSLALAVGIVPVAIVGGVYAAAEALAHTWNPFL